MACNAGSNYWKFKLAMKRGCCNTGTSKTWTIFRSIELELELQAWVQKK